MRIRTIAVMTLAAAAAITAVTVAVAQQKPVSSRTSIVVYKTPTCGCCSIWVTHLQANGFQVEANNVSQAELTAMGSQAGVTDDLASCHTAKVGNYVVEGHVPAADIHRLLKEKPAVAGIAAPGMPLGSPGMEQGGRKEPYSVIAFTKDGKKTTFAKH